MCGPFTFLTHGRIIETLEGYDERDGVQQQVRILGWVLQPVAAVARVHTANRLNRPSPLQCYDCSPWSRVVSYSCSQPQQRTAPTARSGLHYEVSFKLQLAAEPGKEGALTASGKATTMAYEKESRIG